MPVVQKEFLTVGEFAAQVGRVYNTIRMWIKERRVQAEPIEKNGRTRYRIPTAEAERVKNLMDRGLWV